MPLRHRPAVFTPTTLEVSSSRKSPGERASTARLIAEHLAFPGGLGSLIQKKRFDDFIGHLHKNVLFAKWIILFEIDGLIFCWNEKK